MIIDGLKIIQMQVNQELSTGSKNTGEIKKILFLLEKQII